MCYRGGLYIAEDHSVQELHGMYGAMVFNRDLIVSWKGVSLYYIWDFADLSRTDFYDLLLQQCGWETGARRIIQSAFSWA